MARRYAERKRSFVGQHFSARCHSVSTAGQGEPAGINPLAQPEPDYLFDQRI